MAESNCYIVKTKRKLLNFKFTCNLKTLFRKFKLGAFRMWEQNSSWKGGLVDGRGKKPDWLESTLYS